MTHKQAKSGIQTRRLDFQGSINYFKSSFTEQSGSSAW
jgi:hypothetical protein